MEDGLDPLVGVSRETTDALDEFAALLVRWTRKINLISAASVENLRDRHLRDSAQLYHATRHRNGHWLDLGSGGGLPALVCAILAKGEGADLRFTLVESDARKCAFLTTAVRTLDLPAEVERSRIEALPPIPSEIISARALASLPALLAFAEPHWTGRTDGLFPKGSRAHAEIEEAMRSWHFKLDRIQSITDSTATLLKIGELSRA